MGKEKNRILAGFSLIELVVAMGIFVLIATVILANFRQGQKEDNLRLAATELSSDIRRVQTLGMSGQITGICKGEQNDGKFCEKDQTTDCPDGTCEDSVPAGGYGINIILPPLDEPGATQYHLFADDGDQKYSNTCPDGTTLCQTDEDCLGEADYCNIVDKIIAGGTINLPPGAEIVDAAVGNLILARGEMPLPVDISFKPPKPTPWLRAGDQPLENVEICLKVEYPAINSCRLIRVNGVSGQVKEETWDCNAESLPCEPES